MSSPMGSRAVCTRHTRECKTLLILLTHTHIHTYHRHHPSITSVEEVKDYATKMLGKTLVTKQTGTAGKPVNVVFVQERVYARREIYFSIMLDRQTGGPLLIGSASGGVSIEEIAEENPDAIVRHPVDINVGLTRDDAEQFAKKLGFSGTYVAKAADEMCKLYQLFCDCDATLVEINPMIEVPKGGVVCADAKVNIDDSAEFRQPELFEMRDWSQEDYRDLEAAKFDLNYIGLDGNIGCIVNGAGLAMATMDIIKMQGGEPAKLSFITVVAVTDFLDDRLTDSLLLSFSLSQLPGCWRRSHRETDH